MEKIKQFIESEKGKDILIVIIVILVGLGSFELGRLSKEASSSGLKIEYPNQNGQSEANAISSVESSGLLQNTKTSQTVQNLNPTGKSFFASNRGSKYYTTSCSAGKTIKQENRIYFTTGEEAEKAGYVLSTSCN
jgi:hypothetical protein